MLKSDGIRTPPETWLRRAGTWSPLRRLNIRSSDRSHSAWLKLEMFNPAGSVKYRTALSLLRALDQDRPLVPGTTIVESTSGNLGLALAELSAEIGCHFVAVVDPKLPSPRTQLWPRPAPTSLRSGILTSTTVTSRTAASGSRTVRRCTIPALDESVRGNG